MSEQSASLPRSVLPAFRLWRHDPPRGDGAVLSGTAGGVKVLVFPNPAMRDAADAEFILCFGPRAHSDADP